MRLLHPRDAPRLGSGRRRGVTLLSGFLGSGKTTLLRAELRRSGPDGPTVLLNDFGATAVDDVLLVEGGTAPVVITGGCVCCTRREELASALRQLLDAEHRGTRHASDHVVLETSGLSDPGPIAFTLADDPVLRHHYELVSTCVTVDALTGLSSLERHEIARRQLLVADELVVTKADLVDEDTVGRLVRRLRESNASARISVTAGGELLRHVPGSAVPTLPRRNGLVKPTGHLDDVRTLELVTSAPLDWQVFTVWLTLLLHRYGPDVLRVKGVLDVRGVGHVGINGVQHVVHEPEHITGSVPAGTRLVLVLRGLDPQRVEQSFLVLHGLPRSEQPRP